MDAECAYGSVGCHSIPYMQHAAALRWLTVQRDLRCSMCHQQTYATFATLHKG
jgi:hypothetical protein